MVKIVGFLGIIVIGTAVLGGFIGYAIGRSSAGETAPPPGSETGTLPGGAGSNAATVSRLLDNAAVLRWDVTVRGRISALAEPAFAIVSGDDEEIAVITETGPRGTFIFEKSKVGFEQDDNRIAFQDLKLNDEVEVYARIEDTKVIANAVQRIPSP